MLQHKFRSSNKNKRFFVAVLALALPSAVLVNFSWSEQVVDLYEYSVVVTENQQQSELDQIIADGFAEVLIRASGQPSILSDPNVIAELRNAEKYHFYTGNEDAGMIDTDGDGAEDKAAQRLVVKYAGPMIDQLLRDLQLPFWQPNRPNTLLWMVVDNRTEGRQLVSSTFMPEAIKYVAEAAQRRGLPVEHPLMDLEDQVALPPDRLWRLDERAIIAASERYNPDSILVGRLTQTSRGEWQSNWTLIHKGDNEVIDSRDLNLDSAIATVIDQVADYYFARYGVQRGSGSLTSITVDVGVDDFAEYHNVLKYLENLAVVREIQLIGVFQDRLWLNVYAEGQRRLFEETLTLDKKLVPDSSPATIVSADDIDVLRLTWQ